MAAIQFSVSMPRFTTASRLAVVVDSLTASTVVYRPAEPIYEFLVDFPRYAEYSEYLRSVRSSGEQGAGAAYELRFGWRMVEYSVRSRVTDVDPPRRINFEITSGIRADGEWQIEPLAAADEPKCKVTFTVRYETESIMPEQIDAPSLISLDWLIERVRPLIEAEAREITSRVVADLEDEQRDVELRVET